MLVTWSGIVSSKGLSVNGFCASETLFRWKLIGGEYGGTIETQFGGLLSSAIPGKLNESGFGYGRKDKLTASTDA